MVVPLLTRHWRTALRMLTLHIVTLRRNVLEPQAWYRERLAGTILPPTTETFGANDVQPRERKFTPSAYTMVGQPTQIMKSNDVPRTSYIFGVLRLQCPRRLDVDVGHAHVKTCVTI